ncbi:MAG: DUF885 family protein [Acidobacteriota bacterium]
MISLHRFLFSRALVPTFLCLGLLAAPESAASGGPQESPAEVLHGLIGEALAVATPTMAAEEVEAAAATYRSVLERLEAIEREALGADDAVDADLLERHAKTRLFEIEELALWRLVPKQYFVLYQTDSLFLRPCGRPDRAVREAVQELERLPEILANGRKNLDRPARVWTENAIYQAYYAKKLLNDHVLGEPGACVDDPALSDELRGSARRALEAVESFEAWLETELLPRSDRSPAWTPEQIERYQFVHEGLTEWGVDEMLELAEMEAAQVQEEMLALARRIHPSGDLETVWEVMQSEAPPWEEVLPMARRYVDLMSDWLHGPGAHVLSIPEHLDYGARVASPMARRDLSFGGAEYGPTVAGRLSGYYVVTPVEERLDPEARRARLGSYNPYWTDVISYHEWIGHNVQRAFAEAHVERPMRAAYPGIYLSQAWSFYLEKLMEDEGYYETLPHMEALKTAMARRQMRMWRIQRILTKLKMARGEMTFDEAVDAYVETIGMSRENAFIEVQRDSQNPYPPAREIVGELEILELRDDYRRRMGEHYRMKEFHEALLRHGALPLPTIRRLMGL